MDPSPDDLDPQSTDWRRQRALRRLQSLGYLLLALGVLVLLYAAVLITDGS